VPLPFTDLARYIANLFDQCANRPAPLLATRAEIGNYGERVAAAFLWRRGYRVLYHNYRTERGEIDLICRSGELLVFVEVRTRSTEEFGRPAESIDIDKQESVRSAALHYLELLQREDLYYRFDVVEVVLQAGKIPVCTLHPGFFT
jgi:putative endonuclease